jgi:hypothetical protein
MEKIIFIIIVLVGLIFLAFWYLIVSTVKLSKRLDDVEYEANEAETITELETAWDNLKKVNKDCWHRTFGTRVTIIKTIIDTKYKMLTK